MKFEEFLSSCSVMLEGEDPLILSLIKKRHDNCSESFRSSEEMASLLETTSTKMRTDEQRLFVHLKNFLTLLKTRAAGKDEAASSSRKRKAENPLQAVAKLSRIEDSHSDGSDLEGMLQLQVHQTSVLSSVPQAVSASQPSQISVVEPQNTAKTSECPVKVSDKVGTMVYPPAGKDSNHTLPSLAENKSAPACTPLYPFGKELNSALLSNAGEESSRTLCSHTQKDDKSAVNSLGSALYVDSIHKQSCPQTPSHSQSQFCSSTENGPLAQGNTYTSLPENTPSSIGFPAHTARRSDGKDESTGKIIGSLEELVTSGEKSDLGDSKPENGCSDLHKIHGKPDAQISDSKLIKKPMQFMCPIKNGEISVTEALPSVLSSSSNKITSTTVSQPESVHCYKAVVSKTTEQLKNQIQSSNSSILFQMTCDDEDVVDYGEEEQKKPVVKGESDVLTSKAGVTADKHQRPVQPSKVSSLKEGCSGSGDSCNSREAPETQDKFSRKAKHVKKYEELLEKIRDEIEKVRETELSLEDLDDEDSSYIFEDRLQKKFIKVWNKLCRLKECSTSSGRPVDKRFRFEGTRYPEINRKIQKFVNRPDTFPDFHDIKGIVKKVSTRCKLGLSVQHINEISREAFLDVGNALQKRRHEDFISTFHSRQTVTFSSDQDPALLDDDLRRKLDENQRVGKSRLEEVISKYSHLQMQLAEAGKADSSGTDHERSDKSNSDREVDECSVQAKLKTATRMQAGNSLTSDDDENAGVIELDIAEECHLLEEYHPGRSHHEEPPTTGAGNDDQQKDSRSEPENAVCHGGKSGPKVSEPKELTKKVTVVENSKRDTLAKDMLKHNSPINMLKPNSPKNMLKHNSPIGCVKDNQIRSWKQSPGVKVNGDAVGQKGQQGLHTNKHAHCFPSHSHSLHHMEAFSKSRSPVMVKTSLKLPKFLFRNNGMHSTSKPDNLFYPDKVQGSVSGEENEDGITIICSSDEETSRVMVKTEPCVKKEEDDCDRKKCENVIVLSDSD